MSFQDQEERKRYEQARVGTTADPETKAIMDGGQLRAKYKIEIRFGPGRTTRTDYNALVTIWESGKHFHGGGDDLAYWCLDCRVINDMNIDSVWKFFQDLRRRVRGGERVAHGCGNVILSDQMVNGVAFCQHCQKGVACDYLTGHLGFHGSTGELSAFVAGLFNDLGRNSDIYCKYHRDDIRYQTMVLKKGAAEAHKNKGLFIYTLNKIITDTVAGASLENRLRAFFSA